MNRGQAATNVYHIYMHTHVCVCVYNLRNYISCFYSILFDEINRLPIYLCPLFLLRL